MLSAEVGRALGIFGASGSDFSLDSGPMHASERRLMRTLCHRTIFGIRERLPRQHKETFDRGMSIAIALFSPVSPSINLDYIDLRRVKGLASKHIYCTGPPSVFVRHCMYRVDAFKVLVHPNVLAGHR